MVKELIFQVKASKASFSPISGRYLVTNFGKTTELSPFLNRILSLCFSELQGIRIKYSTTQPILTYSLLRKTYFQGIFLGPFSFVDATFKEFFNTVNTFTKGMDIKEILRTFTE